MGSITSWRSRVVEDTQGQSYNGPLEGGNTKAGLGLVSSSAAASSNGTSGSIDEQGSDDDDDDDDNDDYDACTTDWRPAVMQVFVGSCSRYIRQGLTKILC